MTHYTIMSSILLEFFIVLFLFSPGKPTEFTLGRLFVLINGRTGYRFYKGTDSIPRVLR